MENRCTATAKSTGERCKRPAIKGSNVCYQHGGAADQVQQKAQERLDRMADDVTADMQAILEDLAAEYDHADREQKVAIHRELHKTWKAILDRTGHGPTEKREVDMDADVSGSLFELPDGVTDQWSTDGDD